MAMASCYYYSRVFGPLLIPGLRNMGDTGIPQDEAELLSVLLESILYGKTLRQG